MVEALAIGVLCLWSIMSVAVYVPRWTPWVRGYDVFSLIPEWKFFAPTPPQQDYRLLYRDVLAGGMAMAWSEVSVAEPRRWWNFVWNPGRRARKAFFDLVSETAKLASQKSERLETSIPYLTILNMISEKQRATPAEMTQFLILLSRGEEAEEPQVMMISAVHEL